MAETNEKKQGFFKRLISTKGLTRVLLTGVVVAAAGILLSGLTTIAAIPTAVAVGIGVGTGVAAVAGAGIGAAGLTGLATRGIVHVAKMIFNKNYREEVRNRRAIKKLNKQRERENAKEQKRIAKEEKRQARAARRAPTPTPAVAYAREGAEGLLDEFTHPEPVVLSDLNDHELEPVEEKALGFFDILSEANQALYNTNMAKNTEKMFAGYDQAKFDVVYTKSQKVVEYYNKKIINGETLTEAEQKNLVRGIVVIEKGDEYVRIQRERAERTGGTPTITATVRSGSTSR